MTKKELETKVSELEVKIKDLETRLIMYPQTQTWPYVPTYYDYYRWIPYQTWCGATTQTLQGPMQ